MLHAVAAIGVLFFGYEVGDEEIAIIIILHPHEIAQSPEIVAQMEVSRGAYAAQYYLFFHFSQFNFGGKITK